MEEKSYKNWLIYFFLILAIIIILVMGMYIYKLSYDKNNEIQKSTELESQVTSLNGTVNDLQNKINTISETINSNENTEEKNDDNKVASQCQKKFEDYFKLTRKLYCGGSLDLLKDLNLVAETPSSTQYETIEYNQETFYKTDIKYVDFKSAMLKYMSESFFESEIDNDGAKNVNEYLQIYANSGTYSHINITKFELVNNASNTYKFNLLGTLKFEDGSPAENVNWEVTFENNGMDYVVSDLKK